MLHRLSQFFYMENKFGFLEKRMKTIDIKRDEISQKNSRLHAFFLPQN